MALEFGLAETGATGLGFVFGWTLYFANRGKSGQISASDLGAMVAAVAGGTVISGFGDAANVDIMGAYGIGLFAGFMSYFLLLAYFTSRKETPQAPSALLSVEADPSVRPPQDALALLSRAGPLTATAPTGNAQQFTREVNQALAALDVIILDVGEKLVTADGQDFADLTELDFQLQRLKMSLWASLGIAALNSDEVAALSVALDGETQRLKTEAGRMKALTQQITKVDEMIAKIDKLRASVSKLV